jgi:hypothetical protein
MTGTFLAGLRTIAQQAESGDPFAQLVFAGDLDQQEFEELLGRAGRVNGPALLFDAWYGESLTHDVLAAVIGGVWSAAEYPNQCLEHETWRELFDAAGFTIDGVPAERPTASVELWRGSVPERRTDWSWSTDRAVAEKFAAGVRGRKPGRLYRVMAPPQALLCANNDRSEAEYVVDTRDLVIEEVTG